MFGQAGGIQIFCGLDTDQSMALNGDKESAQERQAGVKLLDLEVVYCVLTKVADTSLRVKIIGISNQELHVPYTNSTKSSINLALG